MSLRFENFLNLFKHSATVAANLTQKQQPSQNIYDPYWSDDKIEQGLADKSLIKSRIRINQRNYEDAFVSDPVITSIFLK